MGESIQCWQCGTRMTLDELASNDGDCPRCEVEVHLAEYLDNALSKVATLEAERAEQWSLRREAEAKVDTQAAVIAELQAELAKLRQQARVEVMPDVVEFAVSRWEAEVKHRPLVNVHRRALDGTWRQIIRFAGGDPDELCGPDHDTLIARLNKGAGSHD